MSSITGRLFNPIELGKNLVDICIRRKTRGSIADRIGALERELKKPRYIPLMTRRQLIAKVTQLESKNTDGRYDRLIAMGKWRIEMGPIFEMLKEHRKTIEMLRPAWDEEGISSRDQRAKSCAGVHVSANDILAYMRQMKGGISIEEIKKATVAAIRIRTILTAQGFNLRKYED